MNTWTFPIGTFPILVPIELLQIVFPTTIPQVGDSTDFVQEEPQGLQCSTKIVATCVVEAVSTCLDTLTVDSPTFLERPSFSLSMS